MLTLIFAIFSSFASFLTAVFFIYKWRRQTPKNPSTLIWGFSFFIYSATHAISAITGSNVYNVSAEATKTLSSIRGILTVLFFVLIFWATIRLITRKRWIVCVICALVFVVFSAIVLFRDTLFESYQNYVNFSSYAFFLPAGLILMAIFLILYGVLMAEAVERRRGIMLIILSWLTYSILAVLVPVLYPDRMEYWYGARTFSTLLLLFGFIIMDYESKKALEHLEQDRVNHHHLK